MSNSIEIPKADDLDSCFLLYRFSSDDRLTKRLKGQPQTDFLDVLAAATNLNIPFLPIIWQIARASVGIGGTSSVRQAPIDIQTDLAFKLVKDDEKALGSRSNILALIRNEIQILSHPRLRAHPNIVDLLGICWDIPDKDVVWPALVFEKSYFGDLRRFAGLPIWKELRMKDRLKVCIDIGNALAEMHCCNIIHGDIKPQNVLIFKDLDSFVSKTTDFGYSHHYTSSTEGCCLPLSKPWEAPDVDGSDKEFSLEQAKVSDIYSYALLCAWVLYGDQFFNPTTGYSGPIDLALSDGAELKSIMMLETLKSSKQLEQVVLNCVSHDTGLESTEIEALKELFRTALGEKQRASKEIWECFKLLEQPNPDLDRSPGTNLSDEFKINAAILQYYEADHRVRNYIANCLKQRVEGAIHHQVTNDVVQLAVCYYIGFGFPKDNGKFANLVANEDLKRLVEAEIHSIAITPKDYDHPFIARIFAEGHLGNLHQNQQNQNFELLLETEQVLARELDDLVNSINDFYLKWAVTGTLVDCLRTEGKWDPAEKLESKMLEVKRKVSGTDNANTVTGLTNLAHLHWQQGKSDRALEATQEALQISMRTQGPDDPITMMIMGNIASISYSLGNYAQAEKLELHLEERRTAVLGKDHPDTLTSIANRAAILWRQGRLGEAESLAILAYEGRRRIFGNDQPDTVISMSNLALIYQSQGQYNKAELLQIKAVEISKRTLGELSPNTLMNMANLALNYWYRRKFEEAEDLDLHVVARRKHVLGPDHPDTLTSIANLALVYGSQGRFEEAIELETQVLEKSRAALGETHPDTLLSIDNLSETYRNIGKLAEAEKLWSEALAKRKEVLGELHPDTMENTHKLLLVYKDLGKEQEIKEILNWLESLES